MINAKGPTVGGIAAQLADIVQREIDVMHPPFPLIAAKGDGVTDDYPAIRAAIDYAIANKRNVKIPTATYILSSPLIFNDSIHLTIEGGDKENCKLQFKSPIGIQFMRGVINLSDLQIVGDLPVQANFQALQLGDTVNVDANDSLHWSRISRINITGCNQGIRIGNFFDSQLDDIDISYLSGTNPVGVNVLPGTSVNSNNLLFNRLRVEQTTDGGTLLNFNAGSSAATANFTFNGCHFEAHRLNCNLINLNNVSNVTFISCQISHSGATGETVEANLKDTFVFNSCLGVKFIACGIGGSFTTTAPVSNVSRLMKLMGTTRFVSFDNCLISPPYQGGSAQGSWLFNVDASFTTGEYPVFDNCMFGDATHTFDRLLLGFSNMAAFGNKFYMGMGVDYGLHVNAGKWDLNNIPDDANNFSPFSTFMQNGMFRTAGIIGRHKGTLAAGTSKVIAFNGRTGSTINSGIYLITMLNSSNFASSAIVAYESSTNTVTSIFLGNVFTTVKDTASKINVYSASNQLNIQNTSAVSYNYSIVPFFVS